MDILFFDGYSRDPSKWKRAWTRCSHPDVSWPEKWLPTDLGFDVRLLFVSYHGQPSVADVVDNLFKTLVIRDELDLCKNHQSLALIGLGYGALVLNDFVSQCHERGGDQLHWCRGICEEFERFCFVFRQRQEL
ncbi:unnamed protein product [Sphagnum jensenii]|uniref:Uncharacterized protein n=1 Tax=Sphagnum jensenii TaxID=128206 RepID=A0ABP0WJB6_9BRYO